MIRDNSLRLAPIEDDNVFRVTVSEEGYQTTQSPAPGGGVELVKTMGIHLKLSGWEGSFPVLLVPYLAMGAENQTKMRKELEAVIAQRFVGVVSDAVASWAGAIAQGAGSQIIVPGQMPPTTGAL